MVQLRNGGEPKEWLDSETLTAQEMDFLVHMLPKNEAPNLRERSRSPKMDPKSIQFYIIMLSFNYLIDEINDFGN